MKKIAGSLHNFKNIINNKLQTESSQRSECVSALEDDIKALEEELSKVKAQLDEQIELPRLSAHSVTSGVYRGRPCHVILARHLQISECPATRPSPGQHAQQLRNVVNFVEFT